MYCVSDNSITMTKVEMQAHAVLSKADKKWIDDNNVSYTGLELKIGYLVNAIHKAKEALKEGK